jgi:hypothetical protein
MSSGPERKRRGCARVCRRERVVGGVYKVRANLEGGDLVALRTEGGHEARGYGGLSDAGVGSRDDYTWDFYHSIPF